MNNEKGVSPVIGTIILIAITVIVAGTIGYYATGFGTPEDKPNVSISFSGANDNSSEFQIDHIGGESAQGVTVNLTAENFVQSPNLDDTRTIWGPDNFSVGKRINIDLANVDNVETLTTGDRITVLHESTGTLLGAVDIK